MGHPGGMHQGHSVKFTIYYEAKLAKDLPNGLKKGEELHFKGKSIFEFSEDGKIVRLVDITI